MIRQKKTDGQFKAEIKAFVGDEYTVLGEYVNAATKLLMRHNTCGCEWNVSPNNFLRGHGCPKCSGNASVTNRIGERHVANNGCEYTIVEANNSHDMLVEFEDGMRVRTTSSNIEDGAVGHPTLRTLGSGAFAGFTTQSAFHEDGDAYYICKCQKCGFRDVLTPKQMLEHKCECVPNSAK